MRTFITRCVILGTKNLGEKDKLVHLYSEDFGKIVVKAKGARSMTSKFLGHIQTLNFCTATLYFSPKSIILTEIISEHKPRQKKEVLFASLIIAEITNRMLFENQTMENLLRLMEKTLQHLNETGKIFLITSAYIIKFLDKIGIIPNYRIQTKYDKFLKFLKTQKFSEIEKISVTKEEQEKTKQILQKIIEEETEKPIKLLSNLLE